MELVTERWGARSVPLGRALFALGPCGADPCGADPRGPNFAVELRGPTWELHPTSSKVASRFRCPSEPGISGAEDGG